MSGRLSTENSPWPGQTTAREARLDEVGCQTRVHVFPGLDQLETAVEQWSRAADRGILLFLPRPGDKLVSESRPAVPTVKRRESVTYIE